MPKIQLH